METVLWAMVVESLRSLQTFWQIRFFSSNPADYRCTQGCWLAALCFAALCCAVTFALIFFVGVSAAAPDYRKHIRRELKGEKVKVQADCWSCIAGGGGGAELFKETRWDPRDLELHSELDLPSQDSMRFCQRRTAEIFFLSSL